MKYEECDFEHNFINVLTKIPERPTHLWYRGKLPERSPTQKVVSIVGSRKCSSYGETIAYKLAYDLAKLGVIIVSGLAYGIDSCAHRGCLDAGGVTVAVLGTPIDKIYPVANNGLAERILEKGAIISEYAPGSETKAYRFLERNRIVSGLADVVVIVEASEKSGTFSTASFAATQSKKLYAVPGDITRPTSIGCNMILGIGAYPYINFEDFVSGALGVQLTDRRKIDTLAPDEAAIAEQIEVGNINGEDIAKALDIGIATFNQRITLLEIKNVVRPLGCNQWALV